MGLSKRTKSKGYWRGRSCRHYKNCYKDLEGNEADSVFVIHKSKVYFATQFAYYSCGNQSYLVLGPEVSEDSLALAEANGCL